MTNSELCHIEWTMKKAVEAAKVFASPTSTYQLEKGLYLLSELRQAGSQLNSGITAEERKEVLERLAYTLMNT